jgi:hypothetical protein
VALYEDCLYGHLEAWKQPRRRHCSPAILAGQLVNTLLQHVDLNGLGARIDDPVLENARLLIHPHFLQPIMQPVAGREDFHNQIRSTLDVMLLDDVQTFYPDEDNIRLQGRGWLGKRRPTT